MLECCQLFLHNVWFASIYYYLWLFYYAYVARYVTVLQVKCAFQQIYVVPVPHNSEQVMVYSL